MKDEAKCTVDKWLAHWIRIIYRNMTNLHNSKLSKHGLTTAQVSVLARLWMNDGLTQKEIAESLQIRPASLTGLVDTLVSKGWTERREDVEDARIKRLYLTEQGNALRLTSLEVSMNIEDILGKGFSDEEKQLLLCWLKKVYRNLE